MKSNDLGARVVGPPAGRPVDDVNLRFVAFLSSTAALGGLLFGFDVAIITGAGPFLERHFQLDHLALGWAFSSLLFGCAVGAIIAGRLTDLVGRKRVLMAVAVLFALTTAATGLAPTFTTFIVARLLGGLAVGGASIVSPMYVAEVAPAALRGRMGAFYQLSITVGILVSYGINYALRDAGDWNWRWMFISGVAPSLVLIALLLRAPETPRYLLKVGKRAEALALLRLIAGDSQARAELGQIAASLAEGPVGWRELWRPGVRRAVVVGFVLAILIHVSGINTIIDYAPIIFQSAGAKMNVALFSTFVLGITNVVFTLVSFCIIDRHGRKPLYVVGSFGMTAVLATLALLAAFDRFTGWGVLALIMAYIAFFASCIGPVFWTLVPEIYPNRVRGTAMVVPVLTQWIANAVVVLLFPLGFHQIGMTATFALLGTMALAQALFTWRFVPETRNRTLEEIEQQWR